MFIFDESDRMNKKSFAMTEVAKYNHYLAAAGLVRLREHWKRLTESWSKKYKMYYTNK